MTLEQALNNIKTVCAAYRGTLEEHQALQTAIQTIEAELAKVAPAVQQTKEGK